MRLILLAVVLSMFVNARRSFARVELPPDSAFAPPTIPLPKIESTKVCNVKDFGAAGDGTTVDTAAINKTIETCHAEGGGVVRFPTGKYLVASVRLRSNVRLELDADAEIVGDKTGYLPPEPNPFSKHQDFGHSHFHNSVLFGEDLENVSIVGGKINGGGAVTSNRVPEGGGDKVIAVRTGKNLLFKDITHESGAHFVYLLNDCENVAVNNVVIKKTRDAIDLMGCRNVAVSDCNFTGCSDDTIGLKSDYALGRKISSENIWVWNNYFESGCNGLQFGSETAGDFRNVFFWDITINRAFKAGIGITSNDGGVIENVHYKNIKIKGAANPIFMVITPRLRTGEKDVKLGKIRNVTIQDVTATDVVAGRHHGPANASTINGLPEAPIEDILLHNVKITYKGAEKPEEAVVIPPLPKGYSPNSMGVRPASGFFLRHARRLVFRNVEIAFESQTVKPVIVAQDIHGLELQRVSLPMTPTTQPIRLVRVEGIRVQESPHFEIPWTRPDGDRRVSPP